MRPQIDDNKTFHLEDMRGATLVDKIYLKSLPLDKSDPNGKRVRREIWAPKLAVRNLVHRDIDLETRSVVVEDVTKANPVVIYKWRLLATFQTEYNFQRFPFDGQALDIVLSSVRREVDFPAFLVEDDETDDHQSVVSRSNFVKNSEYYLHPHLRFIEGNYYEQSFLELFDI